MEQRLPSFPAACPSQHGRRIGQDGAEGAPGTLTPLTVHLVRVGRLSRRAAEAGAIAQKPTLAWGVAQAVLCLNAFGVHRGTKSKT